MGWLRRGLKLAVQLGCAALALVLLSIASLVDAQEVEVLRGTERETHRVGDGATRTERGVEIRYGTSPGAGRVDLETKGYTLGSDERRGIRRRVDRVLEVFRSELGIRVAANWSVDLEVLGRRASYERRAGAHDRSIGFYDHTHRKAVVSGGGRRETATTIVHESTHAVLMDRISRVPAWLNEGLAEYFEHLEATETGAVVPAQPRRLAYLRRAVGSGDAFPLEAFLALDGRRWHRLDSATSYLAYTQAWSLVTFLMERDEGRAALRSMLADLRRRPDTTAAVLARHHYPGGLSGLEQDWRTWLGERRRDHHYRTGR